MEKREGKCCNLCKDSKKKVFTMSLLSSNWSRAALTAKKGLDVVFSVTLSSPAGRSSSCHSKRPRFPWSRTASQAADHNSGPIASCVCFHADACSDAAGHSCGFAAASRSGHASGRQRTTSPAACVSSTSPTHGTQLTAAARAGSSGTRADSSRCKLPGRACAIAAATACRCAVALALASVSGSSTRWLWLEQR